MPIPKLLAGAHPFWSCSSNRCPLTWEQAAAGTHRQAAGGQLPTSPRPDKPTEMLGPFLTDTGGEPDAWEPWTPVWEPRQ